MSFWFFFAWAAALGGVLTFGPEAARVLHEVPLSWVATCVTVYMLGSAGGMLVGGYLVADPSRADRVVAVSLSVATVFALIPMALGLSGGGVFISKPLAIVVIGGLVSSTALTLLLVPVLYHLVEGFKERRSLARGEIPFSEITFQPVDEFDAEPSRPRRGIAAAE